MLTQDEIARYGRQLLLPGFGMEAQEKLKKARALVVGAGGLGCPVLQYLAAAGVGTLGIADDDAVSGSNLHRQVIYDVKDCGRKKVLAAFEKLSLQNPYVKFVLHDRRITSSNALSIFEYYDVIIDGTDNFSTRYLVNDACVLLGKPLVYGAIHRFEGQVSVFNALQRDGRRGPAYRCLFPQPPASGEAGNCAEAGVLGVLPGIIGTLMANEAVKLITGTGETLSGKLFVFDALTMQTMQIELERKENNIKPGPRNEEEFLRYDYSFSCGMMEPGSITAEQAEELLREEDVVFVDVRELYEQPRLDMPGVLSIPLPEIRNRAGEIPANKILVLICRSGFRSRQAMKILKEEFGLEQVFSLEGGINSWNKQILDIQ